MEIIHEDETLDDIELNGIHIIQKKSTFRFGVDAVLLANFTNIKHNHRVMDLCTGGGIVPFIISGKTKCKDIHGLELQEDLVEMANRSLRYNNLQDRITFHNKDLKDLKYIKSLDKFDVVTVNPPYKLQNSGIINSDDKNAIARHEILCTLEDVIVAAKVMLKDNGRFYMVHRPDRLVDIFTIMRENKIEPKRIRMVHPSVNKTANILIVEGQKLGGRFLKWEPPLYVRSEDGSNTDEIEKIYGRDK